MNLVLIALLMQSFFMPPRTAVENPAVVTPVPKQLKKDYDKLWARFLTGKEDPKIIKDSANLLKKEKDFEPVLMLGAYVDLYAGRRAEAERKLETVLARNPRHRIATNYLADLTFARQEYARASELYARLLALDGARTDVEPKRQKAFLLATENLLRNAAKAEQENRPAEAEAIYREALRIAPNEPILHAGLGELLLRQQKWDEALEQFRRQLELDKSSEDGQRHLAEALMNLGRTEDARAVLDRLRETGNGDEELERRVKELDDLGRWGDDIDQLRQIESSAALTRDQLSAVIVRYFPQVMEFRQTPEIVTDTGDSWARLEIQTIVGVGLIEPLPNHTFQPSRTVSRGELAVVIGRLSRLLGLSAASTPAIPMTDLAVSHPLYSDVQLALSFGMLSLDDAGNFDINGSVSGEEAVSCARQLLELLRVKPG